MTSVKVSGTKKICTIYGAQNFVLVYICCWFKLGFKDRALYVTNLIEACIGSNGLEGKKTFFAGRK